MINVEQLEADLMSLVGKEVEVYFRVRGELSLGIKGTLDVIIPKIDDYNNNDNPYTRCITFCILFSNSSNLFISFSADEVCSIASNRIHLYAPDNFSTLRKYIQGYIRGYLGE